ncbi:hypothetical protein SynMITS9220_00867 [Synechococcus sp. MIT S9220]|nr:hypothetical protein SynMITS9220_00867 [Synechococcus sp. MIT S9220]
MRHASVISSSQELDSCFGVSQQLPLLGLPAGLPYPAD